MAIIYARQSLDKDGIGAAVDRQIADCQALADARGWTVTDVLTDNDISASTGATRPAFQKLLERMRAGTVDVVLVWHLDRLTRRLIDLEEIIALCESTGVRLATVTGDLDLSTDTGRMLARILASVARGEVERKGARQRRANRQRAERGHVGWTRRPFGYDRDGDTITIVEKEADLIRQATTHVLAGGTLGELVKTWNAKGIPTSTGARWATTTLRRVLLNPRLAGRTVYKGQDYGVGTTPAILDAATFARLEETLRDPRRRTAPSSLAVKYLLSGIALCGVCGAPVYASPFGTAERRWMVYRCKGYHVTRRMDLVDEVVEGTVVARLSRPDALALLTPDVDVDALRKEAAALRERRDDLAQLLAEGLLSGTAVREQSARITAQLVNLERQVAAATGDNPAAAIASAEQPTEAWAGMALRGKRDVIDTLMTVTILPAGKGVRFQPEHIQIEWREHGDQRAGR